MFCLRSGFHCLGKVSSIFEKTPSKKKSDYKERKRVANRIRVLERKLSETEEISSETNISQEKIQKILSMHERNKHKMQMPEIAKITYKK